MTSCFIGLNMRKHKGQIPLIIHHVQQNIVEHHKIQSGCKKIGKELKIPISTIRAKIKLFQSTKDVMNLPGRGYM